MTIFDIMPTLVAFLLWVLIILIPIATGIGIVVLVILAIKALRKYLQQEKLAKIREDEIYRTMEEVNEIEQELKNREDN